MAAVDLHEADVVGPGALQVRVVDGLGVQVRLDPGNGIEQVGRNAVALCRLLPAGPRLLKIYPLKGLLNSKKG